MAPHCVICERARCATASTTLIAEKVLNRLGRNCIHVHAPRPSEVRSRDAARPSVHGSGQDHQRLHEDHIGQDTEGGVDGHAQQQQEGTHLKHGTESTGMALLLGSQSVSTLQLPDTKKTKSVNMVTAVDTPLVTHRVRRSHWTLEVFM